MNSHVDPSTSDDDEDEDPRVAFFKQLRVGFDLAEENRKDESYSYTPIGQIVMGFSSACKASDKESTILGAIQHSLKKPDNTVRSPDFASLRVSPKQDTTDAHTRRRQRDAILLLEVKTSCPGPFSFDEQALFAFHQYPGDVVPVFLTQGNCFTLLLYPRPSNWDAIADKYRDTLESGTDHSPATGQPEPGTSPAAPPPLQETPVSQEETPPTQEPVGPTDAPAARITGRRPADDITPDADAQEPAQPTEEATNEVGKEPAVNASDASPSMSTETIEFLFEEGDLPIPLVIFFCEFILLPDGSGFTPQFLHALLAAMSFSDIKFKSSDRIFRLADGEEVNDAPTTQSLKVAEDAIKAFKAEQEAKKHPEQSASATPSVETVPSNYYNPRNTIPRPTGTDVLWGLRTREVTWQSPGKISRKRKTADQVDGAVAGPSKKRGRPATTSKRGSKKAGRGSGKGRA